MTQSTPPNPLPRPAPSPPRASSPATKPASPRQPVSLSIDEWSIVVRDLGIKDLVSLSQVSRTLYLASTNDTLFRRHTPRRVRGHLPSLSAIAANAASEAAAAQISVPAAVPRPPAAPPPAPPRPRLPPLSAVAANPESEAAAALISAAAAAASPPAPLPPPVLPASTTASTQSLSASPPPPCVSTLVDANPPRRRWSHLFRRYAALQQRPSKERRRGNIHSAVGIGVVADTIVFYHDDLGRLVGLPGAWRMHVGYGLSDRLVFLGPTGLAVIRGDGVQTPATVEVFDARTGARRTPRPLPMPGVVPDPAFSAGRTRRTVVALSAGRDSADPHLVFVQGGAVRVVRVADGQTVRVWDYGESFWFGALVRAEDTRCDGEGDGGERVVAVCQRCPHDTGGARYELLDVVSAERVAPMFELGETERLVDVVLSRDGRWVARRIVKDSRCAVVWSSRRGDDGSWEQRRHNVGWAGGTFAQASSEFGLGADGGEARFMPCGLATVGGTEVDGRVMRVVYGADGESVDHVGGVRRVNGGAFDWARMTGDGRVLMAACRRLGTVSVFVLNEARRAPHSMKSDEGLREMWLIDDHWLIGVGLSGRVFEWHFGAFCHEEEEQKEDSAEEKGEAMEIDTSAKMKTQLGTGQEDDGEVLVARGGVRGLARCRSPLIGLREEWFVAGRSGRENGDDSSRDSAVGVDAGGCRGMRGR